MGDISAGLVRKLEKAGLTAAEKQVLALAIVGEGADGEVEGFQTPEFKMPGLKMGNFEIQELMPRFNQAESTASLRGVVINHEEQC